MQTNSRMKQVGANGKETFQGYKNEDTDKNQDFTLPGHPFELPRQTTKTIAISNL